MTCPVCRGAGRFVRCVYVHKLPGPWVAAGPHALLPPNVEQERCLVCNGSGHMDDDDTPISGGGMYGGVRDYLTGDDPPEAWRG